MTKRPEKNREQTANTRCILGTCGQSDRGLEAVKQGQTYPAEKVFEDLRQILGPNIDTSN